MPPSEKPNGERAARAAFRRQSRGEGTSDKAGGPAAEFALEALVSRLPQAVCLKDRDLRYVWCNPVFAAELGLAPEEIAGRGDLDLFPSETTSKNLARERRVLERGRSEVFEERRMIAGRQRMVRVESAPVFDEAGAVAGVLTISNVDPSKRELRELRRSEQEFRRMWEESSDGMRLADESGMILRVNKAFCRMVGKPKEEIEGKPLYAVYEPGEKEAIMVRHRERFASRSVEALFERELSLWHGGKVWFELSNSFIDVEGEPLLLLSIFRDTTEKRLAQEKLQDFARRLERSNRELQDFAYIASHDLQEPLRKVAVFGDRLKAKCGEALGDEGRDYLERMQSAAARMQALITDLLSFSRVTTRSRPFAPVDLAAVAREVAEDLETRIAQTGGMVEIGALPTIEAEPLHMRQLFQNLIGNALKFHRPDVGPVVKVASRHLPPEPVSPRERVEIIVSDNGIGFEEKFVDRIFQVFQRLHHRGEYEGTGMGLAIARKIVEHHGGSIIARGRPGEGAEFIVTLPCKHIQPEPSKCQETTVPTAPV